MKFVEDRPYAKPEAAARRRLEIVNATDAEQGKVDVGRVNIVFLREGGEDRIRRQTHVEPRPAIRFSRKVFGNRRYWPAIRHYFDIINGIAEDTHCFARGGREIVL